jgi:uncharacterized protein (TIGR02246 family)
VSIDLFEDRIHAASMIKALEGAWNRADASACAAFFAEDGDYLDPLGCSGSGRVAIESIYRGMFETTLAGSAIAYRIETIKRLGPEGMLLSLLQTLRCGGEGGVRNRCTMLLALKSGAWRISRMEITMQVAVRPPAFTSPA